ncbi:hypothetical protein [Streptomyces sp. NPDC016845]|uniref:hypothetical protein n=1 Tax=Streptomyces sp. NPDC016845 TaxID=3364972 RepID=UPI0037A8433E
MTAIEPDHKSGGQWRVDDRDVRKAVQALQHATWDTDNLIDAELLTAQDFAVRPRPGKRHRQAGGHPVREP